MRLYRDRADYPSNEVNSWDIRYLNLAHDISGWSKDPSTQVGAVIVRPDNRVVSIGFNGFPTGIADDERLYYRELKYEIIIHGEINALVSARQGVSGCTLYTWPFLCCSRCTSVMIQAGIKKVVAPIYTKERWKENLALARELFAEAGVEVVEL